MAPHSSSQKFDVIHEEFEAKSNINHELLTIEGQLKGIITERRINIDVNLSLNLV
jgi:hypothetical protein